MYWVCLYKNYKLLVSQECVICLILREPSGVMARSKLNACKKKTGKHLKKKWISETELNNNGIIFSCLDVHTSTFENWLGNYWYQSTEDDYDWTFINSETPTEETGPPSGHGPGKKIR